MLLHFAGFYVLLQQKGGCSDGYRVFPQEEITIWGSFTGRMCRETSSTEDLKKVARLADAAAQDDKLRVQQIDHIADGDA